MQIPKTNEQRDTPDQHCIVSVPRDGQAAGRQRHPGHRELCLGREGLAVLRGSSGHTPSATPDAGSAAGLPWSLGAAGRSPCPLQSGHLGRGALAPGAGTAAAATHSRLPLGSLARLAEWEAAKPSWDSLVQQDGPQKTHILALIWDLFSHCQVFVT